MTIRRASPRSIGATVEKLTRPVFGRHGFDQASIINDWPSIVGADIAAHAAPEKIVFPRRKRNHGTLYLRVDNSAMATELQHLEPQITERINGFFGYAAITAIRLIQAPLSRSAARPGQRAPRNENRAKGASGAKPADTPDADAEIARRLETVTDPELKAALGRLGRLVERDPDAG